MSSKSRLRFAFTIRDGEHAGWTAGSWRVWVNKEDTYIAAASVGGIWKASLHGDESWRIAQTSENARSASPIIEPSIGRNLWEFDPVPFDQGGRMAFAIAPLRAAYLPREVDAKDIHIAVRDSWDEITVAYVWMTEPGIDFENNRIIGGPLTLASGRRVWVSAGTEPLVQPEEDDIVGSVIEPQIPGRHDVTAPGFFVKGLRLKF
ncbi:hypothetical protein IU501_18440 [Nocardia otitidiscaviarum]|uniref:hypothetical protein n=1 Tax=Nocardia otitidiscaviarum TaxID=1823 RepID=UPI00189420E8|nr:hypothetical protein [Nocardia otitidiscaviarum]MBF6134975.1 hypothetical protein [Nocardia otitidiscaviarum]